MLTKGAIEDLIMEHLRPSPEMAPAVRKVPELGKKIFLSDRELRRLRRPGAKSITVPAGAILSPLAMDWIEFDGIQVVRQ